MNQIKKQIDRELSDFKASPELLAQACQAARAEENNQNNPTELMGEGNKSSDLVEDLCGSRKTRRGGRGRRLCICAAAILVLAMGCAAVGASGIFGHFSDYFSGDLGSYHERILQSARHAENENFAVGIDGVVSDDMQCMFVYNVEALSGEARSILRKALGKGNIRHFSDEIQLRASFKDGTEQEIQSFSAFEYMDYQSDRFQSYVITVQADGLDAGEFGNLRAVEISSRGLTLEAVSEPMKTYELTAEEGAETVEKVAESADDEMGAAREILRDVRLSPLGFSFRGCAEDYDVKLIRRDKTIEDSDDISYGSGFSRSNDDKEVWCFGDFNFQIIDLDKYSGLRINGVNYYMNVVE